MYNFEKLQVWQKSMKLVEIIYQLTSKISEQEKFALTDQIKRSSTSIVLNIAEGTGAKSKKEFTFFCRHALKSLYETVAALKIIKQIYKINPNKELEKCDEVSKLLHGLIKYLDSKN